MPKSKPIPQTRTAADTTVKEILDTVCPPRSDTTGAHLVSCGPDAHLLVIQGPESRWLTARVLEFLDALHERTEEMANAGSDQG